MLRVKKGDGIPNELITTRYENYGSGLPWDDGPENEATIVELKHSGVFLTDREASELLDCLKHGYERHQRFHTNTIGKFIHAMGNMH